MTPEKQSLREELEARLRFETLLADLSSKFVNLPAGEVDRQIEGAQRRVCELLGVDRSSLWQLSDEDPGSLKLTHVHQLPGGPPVPARLSTRESFPWTTQRVLEGKILAISRLADLPPEADRDRENYRLYGTKSTLQFPLSVGKGPVFGLLAFASMREERIWLAAIVKRLRLVAQIFTNALARKRSDEALRDGEERLSLAADSAGVGLWSLNLATGRPWATEKTRELLGLSPDEVLTSDGFMKLVHPEDRDLIRTAMQEAISSKGKGRVDFRIVRPDGSVSWIVWRGRVPRKRPGEPDCLMGVIFEITDRKKAEAAARELRGRLISAHEEERTRLARELHDDVTQRLARLAIDAGRIERAQANESVGETMRELREGLVRLSEDIHALSYRLHPSVLEDLGLAEALRTECERVARQESLPVQVNLGEIPETVPREAALCLFRVTQEALRNVVRHARARKVEVSMRGLDGGLHLAVSDDGTGFDPALQLDRPTLGLIGMRERVQLLGGELDVDSAAGRGTTIAAWVPLKREVP